VPLFLTCYRLNRVIGSEGLDYVRAAVHLVRILAEARRLRLTGVTLKQQPQLPKKVER
jgi:hypothetical protein